MGEPCESRVSVKCIIGGEYTMKLQSVVSVQDERIQGSCTST